MMVNRVLHGESTWRPNMRAAEAAPPPWGAPNLAAALVAISARIAEDTAGLAAAAPNAYWEYGEQRAG